ncbi:MAG: patatin family protein [Coriobacteriia bacterium]|nr:patatin family protein [Coriobacteriia bacterium]
MNKIKTAAPGSVSKLKKLVRASLHAGNVVRVKTAPLNSRVSGSWKKKAAPAAGPAAKRGTSAPAVPAQDREERSAAVAGSAVTVRNLGSQASVAQQPAKLAFGTDAAPSAQAAPPQASALKSNVFNTALLFEGGSMRGAYTSAVATYLLEQGVFFNQVYGVSAGSSNLVNYLSRDAWRTSVSFTEFMDDPRTGSLGTFLRGKGAFNAEYIYQQAGKPDGVIPFDFATFRQNPAQCCVPAIDRDTGEDLYFTKEDMSSLDRLTVMVRASSTLPMFMPAPVIDGHVCYDGGFATGGGLPLAKIEADGFEHVVVVRTRKRGYRKDDHNEWARAFFRDYPAMRQAALSRSERYNASCDLLDEWEKDGRAYVFYCDDLTLSGTERDVHLLKENFQAGYDQIRRDWDALMEYVQKWG